MNNAWKMNEPNFEFCRVKDTKKSQKSLRLLFDKRVVNYFTCFQETNIFPSGIKGIKLFRKLWIPQPRIKCVSPCTAMFDWFVVDADTIE